MTRFSQTVTVLLLLCILVVVQSSRVAKGVFVDEEAVHVKWISERAEPSLELSFSVAMRQSNLDTLTEVLLQVSDPNSQHYGQYWSAEQVAALVGTSKRDQVVVQSWLQKSGVSKCEIRAALGDVLDCRATVQTLEALLAVEIYQLTSKESNAVSFSHFNYITVPEWVGEAVDLIQGLSYLPFKKANFKKEIFDASSRKSFDTFVAQHKAQAATVKVLEGSVEVAAAPPPPPSTSEPAPVIVAANGTQSCPTGYQGCSTANGVESGFCCNSNSICCANVEGTRCCAGGYTCCQGQCMAATACPAPTDIVVDPEVLRDHYSVPKGVRATSQRFNQSVVAFTDEYSEGALAYFNAVFNEVNVPVHRYGPAGCLPKCDQVESDLDMQYMSAMGSGIPLWFWYNAAGYTLEWAQEVLATPNAPKVYSISYISGEYQLGAQYIERSNVELQKMGAMGMTVMACSGDTGAPGWSINFPIDTHARNFPFPCPNCPLDVNYCSQITVSSGSLSCNVPSGQFSRDEKRDIPCGVLLNTPSCYQALNNFVAQNSGCQFSVVADSENITRVFSLQCNCSQLVPVTYNNCSISGYQFNITKGQPLTSLYPASSPWVTAVGATQFSDQTSPLCNQKVHGTPITCDIGEISCSIATGAFITSGGGFSTLTPMQNYQSQWVAKYLASGVPLPSASFYNSSNRAYPDVAFGGHNWLISASVNSTETCPCGFMTVDGTSCASPGFAGLVSMLNQELLVNNRPSLGFFNPLLYTMATNWPQAFQDITSGDNYCTEELCSAAVGYRTAIGWDAVTGLGSPNFSQMLNYLLDLN